MGRIVGDPELGTLIVKQPLKVLASIIRKPSDLIEKRLPYKT
jgi:hypothetical protein